MSIPVQLDDVRRRRDELLAKSIADSGAGGHDGGMPPDLPERVAILDTHVAHIREDISTLKGDVRDIRKDMKVDFLLTWGGLFVIAIGLAGMMAKGFKWL